MKMSFTVLKTRDLKKVLKHGIFKFTRNTREYWFYYISAAILLLPIAVYSFYAVPSADDVSNSVTLKSMMQENSSYFLSAMQYSYQLYMKSGGGYYFAAFCNFLLSPFLRAGIFGLRIAVLFFNMFFFLSIFIMIRSFIHLIVLETKYVWAAYILMVFGIINNYINGEIYTWYCVLVAYIFPLSIMFLGFSGYLEALKYNRNHFLMISSICGFFASGSSLNTVVLNCGIYVLLVFYAVKKGEKARYYLFPFLVSFVGGIFNLIAPGYYTRHDEITVKFDVLRAVIETALIIFRRYEYILTRTSFAAVMLFIFVIFYPRIKCRKDPVFTYRHPIAVGILFIFGILLIDFPVVFGYAGYFPERSVFVQDLAIYMLSFVWLFYFMGYLKYNKKGKVEFCCESQRIAYAAGILFIFAVYAYSGTDGWTTPYMVKTIISREAKIYSVSQEKLLDDLENAQEANVILKGDAAHTNLLIKSIGITPDPTNWINTNFAAFFGKESVVLTYE